MLLGYISMKILALVLCSIFISSKSFLIANNQTCVSFFDTDDWKNKKDCSSLVSWTDNVYDSSHELYEILNVYFKMKPNHQCSFDPIELHLMLCSMLYAPCENNNNTIIKFPCKDTCFGILKNCWSLTPLLSCHLLPDTECISNEDLSSYRSKQVKNKPVPVLMEMLVPVVEHGETQLVSPSEAVLQQREQTIHDMRKLLSQSEELGKDKLYESIVAFAKRLLSPNRSIIVEDSQSSPLPHINDLFWTESILANIIAKIKSSHVHSSTKLKDRKNMTCTNVLTGSQTSKQLRSTCMNYISWDSWTDLSDEYNNHLHKYFELRPTYYCTYDFIELHTLICLTAFSPCKNAKSLEICQDACFSILRNCWPLTSVFKCSQRPSNSCIPIEDVNKYRSRYMKRNPPRVHMEIVANDD